MAKVAIAIDAWKLPIFKKHLEEAGYAFEKREISNPYLLILMVKTEFVSKLQPVIEAANAECANGQSTN